MFGCCSASASTCGRSARLTETHSAPATSLCRICASTSVIFSASSGKLRWQWESTNGMVILKKTFHHEELRDHEDFCELGIKPPIPANPDSWSRMILEVHRQGVPHFLCSALFFFAFFVAFVVLKGYPSMRKTMRSTENE